MSITNELAEILARNGELETKIILDPARAEARRVRELKGRKRGSRGRGRKPAAA